MARGKSGRPSKYHTHVEHRLNEVKSWRQDGYTEEQIARLLGIGYETLMNYKRTGKYPEFCEALKESKEALISSLKQTLFQEAMGSRNSPDIVEETQEYDYRLGKMITIKKVVKYSNKPNITSLIFALKNLDPDNWKDRHESTFSEMDMAMENFTKVSEELARVLSDDKD